MVSEARDKILNLFQEDNAKLWLVSYPAAQSPSTAASVSSSQQPSAQASKGKRKREAKAAVTLKPYSEPPSAKKFQLLEIGHLDLGKKHLFFPVIDHIKQGFVDFFSNGKEILHNRTFWSKFFQSLVFELSAGLVVHTGPPRNEAEVRHQLLTPLLNKAAHCASMMKAPGDFKGSEVEYSSEFNLENKTDSSGTPGRKPGCVVFQSILDVLITRSSTVLGVLFHAQV